MSDHLTPQEITDAAEERLTPARRAHLESCASCSSEVEAHAALVNDVRTAGSVPEPSPFFWEQLQTRVHVATANEPIQPQSWWQPIWRPLAAFAVPAAIVAAITVHGPWSPTAPVPAVETAQNHDDDTWRSMTALTSDLSSDEVKGVVAPATAPLIEDLSPRERAALVEILKVEWERE